MEQYTKIKMIPSEVNFPHEIQYKCNKERVTNFRKLIISERVFDQDKLK